MQVSSVAHNAISHLRVRYTFVQFRDAYCAAKSCDKWREVTEQAVTLISNINVANASVPDITFAEINLSVYHPAQLIWAERFGVKGGVGTCLHKNRIVLFDVYVIV